MDIEDFTERANAEIPLFLNRKWQIRCLTLDIVGVENQHMLFNNILFKKKKKGSSCFVFFTLEEIMCSHVIPVVLEKKSSLL